MQRVKSIVIPALIAAIIAFLPAVIPAVLQRWFEWRFAFGLTFAIIFVLALSILEISYRDLKKTDSRIRNWVVERLIPLEKLAEKVRPLVSAGPLDSGLAATEEGRIVVRTPNGTQRDI